MAAQHPHAALLGLIQGPAELLPVSSSGHVAAAKALLGLEGDEAALHLGSLLALVLGRRHEAAEALRRLTSRRIALHLLAGGIPAAAGRYLKRSGRRGQSPSSGLGVGAGLLLVAERAGGERSRWDAGPADGLWLGLAQAAALWPGVSRNGATLAVARLRGFAPEEANLLSREVGVPVTLGAVLVSGPRLDAGTVTAFASAWAALPLLRRVDRGGRLWPFAAERLALAALLVRRGASR